MSYHPANLKLQPYQHNKVIELAETAARLGIRFHLHGIPFGASHDQGSSELQGAEDKGATALGGATGGTNEPARGGTEGE